jgi:lysozyme
VTGAVTAALSQSMFDALVSWTYNLGWGRLHQSSMLKQLNRANYPEAGWEMTKWFRTAGSEWGLLRRRLDEARLFCEDRRPSQTEPTDFA